MTHTSCSSFPTLIPEQYSKCTNRDMKTSLFNAVLDHIPDNRAFEFSLDLLSLHRDEPQLWQKFLKHFKFGSGQLLVVALTIVRLSTYLMKHSDGRVLHFYTQLSQESTQIVERYEREGKVNEEGLIFSVFKIRKMISLFGFYI